MKTCSSSASFRCLSYARLCRALVLGLALSGSALFAAATTVQPLADPLKIGTDTYYLNDHLATTVATVDAVGLIAQIESEAFGQSITNNAANARFTGKPFDEDIDAYVFPYRNYRSNVMRWATIDPSGYPKMKNNQTYPSNPILKIDMSGLDDIYLWADSVAELITGSGWQLSTDNDDEGLGEYVENISGTDVHFRQWNINWKFNGVPTGLPTFDLSSSYGSDAQYTIGYVVQHITMSTPGNLLHDYLEAWPVAYTDSTQTAICFPDWGNDGSWDKFYWTGLNEYLYTDGITFTAIAGFIPFTASGSGTSTTYSGWEIRDTWTENEQYNGTLAGTLGALNLLNAPESMPDWFNYGSGQAGTVYRSIRFRLPE
jgi:RHS repeat-associated protein